MAELGGFEGEDLFRFVDVGALESFEFFDLVHGQDCEEFEEFADVGVFGVAPILVVIIGAEFFRVEPYRAIGGFAHLRAAGGGEERGGEGEDLRGFGAARQFNAVNNIAPLV